MQNVWIYNKYTSNPGKKKEKAQQGIQIIHNVSCPKNRVKNYMFKYHGNKKTVHCNLFLTKVVRSIVINKPYVSTRLTLPWTTSPTCRLLKSFISDFVALLEFNVFKVTSTRFDKGSTDKTLYLCLLVHHTEYWPLASRKKKTKNKTYLPTTSFPIGNSLSGLSTNPSDKFERRILASSFRDNKIKHPFDVTFLT